MPEWFDAFLCPPPETGEWIIAAHEDYSGLVLLQFHDGQWRTADGETNLYEDNAEIRTDYATWTLAPKWMRPRIACLERATAVHEWETKMQEERASC